MEEYEKFNFTEEDCGVSQRDEVKHYKFWCDGVLVVVVGLIGFVGNLLSLFVLSRPSLRDVFHQLLFALACFDILYIVCGGINYTFRGFEANSDVYTILFPYFLHPFTDIAMAGTIFMTVAITVERYLGLCHPLLNPQSRKSWFYVVPVLLFSVLLNVPKFLEIKLEWYCGKPNENGTMVQVWYNDTAKLPLTQCEMVSDTENVPTVDVTALRKNDDYIRGYLMWTRLFTTAIIPVTLLLILNVLIIRDVITSAKKVNRFGSARRQRKEINLSLVLLAIVFLFFICHACRIINDIFEFSNMDLVVNCPKRFPTLFNPPYFMHALMYISHFATILNSSLNFFVYCLVGHTFRRELCRTLGFKNRGLRGDNMVSRRSSKLETNYTLTSFAAAKAAYEKNGTNKSPTINEEKKDHDKNGHDQETANLITIEATEDMIKVESHQL